MTTFSFVSFIRGLGKHLINTSGIGCLVCTKQPIPDVLTCIPAVKSSSYMTLKIVIKVNGAGVQKFPKCQA